MQRFRVKYGYFDDGRNVDVSIGCLKGGGLPGLVAAPSPDCLVLGNCKAMIVTPENIDYGWQSLDPSEDF